MRALKLLASGLNPKKSAFCGHHFLCCFNYITTTTQLPTILSQCSTFKHISQVHSFIISRSLCHDNLLLSKLIVACSRLGFRDYAFSVFVHKEDPNIYLFNTMIKILYQGGAAKDAVVLFNSILDTGLQPDTYSFPFVLKAIAHLSLLEVGREMYGQIIRHGLGTNIHISTGLVHMYSNCGSIQDARLLFEGIPSRDVILWNAIVAGYAKIGDMDGAYSLFSQMPAKNVVSWTTMIAGYAQTNRSNEAIKIFRRMQVEGKIEPDEIALLAVLSACAQLGALDLGEWVHSFIDRRGLCKIVSLMNALIDMYAKCGNIEKAKEVFESMKERSVVTWTAMIAGFALHGLGDEALTMFRRMARENVKPNYVTFLAILSACCHVGLTDLGCWYFDQMSSRYQLKPKIEHYGCMVDLLGRAGRLKEACNLVKEMPFEANRAIWGALLAAATTHGNVELGEHALSHLIEVEPHNSGNYSLLSNIYAAKAKWDAVGKLRKAMKDRGVTKVPGGSSIEIDGSVHEFTSRDGKHLCFESIYEVLHEINGHLRIMGYVPQLYGGGLDFQGQDDE